MSIYGAMFAGVSGLNANAQALGMIADNISNVNTVGFKGTTAQFSTLVTQSASRTTFSPGGVSSSPTVSVDRQGLLQATTSKTDMAVAGAGFFVVNEAAASGTLGNEFFFTRSGSFTADENGDYVNTAGYYLQGWPLTNGTTLPTNTTVLTGVQTVNASSVSGTAQASTGISLGINVPSTAAVAASFSATVQVFDSLGNAHDLQVDFVKAATNSWTVNVQNPVLAGTTTVSGTVTAAVRTITFNGNGTPAVITLPPIAITAWTTGATNSSITIGGGTVNQTDGITQFAGQFSVSKLDQDGLPFGQFTGISVGTDGIVTAVFDNGRQLNIFQIPIAMFPNANGLEAVNGNAYRQTTFSGNLLLQQANAGGAGAVASSALEASTVDLAEEFTKMITTQRAYSASAKIITTADEMLAELIQVIR
jgi:flagellar hook protein FlgE